MINVVDLQREYLDKKIVKKKTFDIILGDLSRVVKNRSILGQKECWLNIPAFVIGRPLYNTRQATKYIIHKMQKEGFTVYDGGGNEIYVSWKVEEVSRTHESDDDDDDDDFMIPSFANLKKRANHVRSLASSRR